MPERRRRRGKPNEGLGAALPPRAKAVMRAFRAAQFSAPGFVVSCGVFPEVSESASDRLHSIVHALADRHLGKRQQMRALKKWLRQLAQAGPAPPLRAEIVDRIESQLTALLAVEATAAYVFGLSVGLAVRSLPDRLER